LGMGGCGSEWGDRSAVFGQTSFLPGDTMTCKKGGFYGSSL
jgi:hypothetical protein